MTAVAHEPITPGEVLLEGFLALDTPEGFRAELIEGEIVVTPPPDGDHEDYISLIVSQVIRKSRTDMQFSGNKGLKLKSGGACPKNHAIPDVRGHEVSGQAPNRVVLNKETRKKWRHPVSTRRSSVRKPSRSR